MGHAVVVGAKDAEVPNRVFAAFAKRHDVVNLDIGFTVWLFEAIAAIGNQALRAKSAPRHARPAFIADIGFHQMFAGFGQGDRVLHERLVLLAHAIRIALSQIPQISNFQGFFLMVKILDIAQRIGAAIIDEAENLVVAQKLELLANFRVYISVFGPKGLEYT